MTRFIAVLVAAFGCLTALAEPVRTSHEIKVAGRSLSYHTTVGYIDLMAQRSDGVEREGLRPIAKMFYVAYTRAGGRAEDRPITFLFNGGPGSSAVWLHMGGLGPRRMVLSDEGEAPAPPYRLADNEETWLENTDLVFVDPVSTGFSRATAGEDPAQFYGYQADVRANAEFIYRYITRAQRWLSPKFIAAESYGAARAAGMADHLQEEYGCYLNGVMLISPLLMASHIYFTPLNDEPYIAVLPSYAATAWYHRKLDPQLQSMGVAELAEMVRAYAQHEFAMALRQGGDLSAERQQDVARQLARFTGLGARFYEVRNLRVPSRLFTTQLLQEEGYLIGRFDGRYRGLAYEPGSHLWPYDPANEAVLGALAATFNHYLSTELRFISERVYKRYGATRGVPWFYGDAFDGFLNPAEDLRKAMLRNPYLKVWITGSYYDLATPFLAAESAVRAMNLPATLRSNVRFTYYESGHSLYVHQSSRVQLKRDVEMFIAAAAAPSLVRTTAR